MESVESRQTEVIQANLDDIRRRIAAAAKSAGRSPEEIEIVAVTKGQSTPTLRAAAAADLAVFGENYVQEALAKQNELADLPGLSWHFIGHLQSNKAAVVVGRFALIQSIDSERLAGKVALAAARSGITQNVLVQIHLGDEESKFGVRPEEAPALCERMARQPSLALRGLMGIAPVTAEEGARADPSPYFSRLRALFEDLPRENRQVLSMGMSGDFEAAVREGATLVRIGTALLGPRPTPVSH
ncbi:MAG TPA: YggS family pyridoxal phosphate-dependent enzyme [Capsulimonadaceae bacterium]|nr:YggS family pyridoxal phosphate-dependent enzyme [Capsulimonadaceae bacterium]